MSTTKRYARGPEWLVNAALGMLFAMVLVVMAAQYAAQGRVWALDAAVGAVVCLIALVRGRHPGRAAALGLVVAGIAAVIARLAHLPGEPGAAAVLGLLVLGGRAVRALARRQAAAVAVAGLALMTVGLLTGEAPSTPFRVGIEVWILALGAGLGLRFLDHRRRAATEAVRQDERLALARELHDMVAHHITGIVVQTQAARIVARRRPESLDATLAGIEEAGGEALAAMRRVVGLLRDADDVSTTVPPASGPDQLGELVRRFDGHGPEVSLRLPADPTPWPPEVATTVHRIVQEALTNIARHAAHARSAAVDITHGPDTVTVTVSDDAPPGHAPRKRHGGYGLIGMRERVEALGGRLSAGPGRDAGWSVHATLPVPERKSR
ncbi:histidine kinase [Streptomyces sp. UNOB3_S3]|uniref:sensor histidine kinase n=1 Tax=Streptomyces sp. UNOB3_S3 TaxID=2871682 RepID=UPI001E459BEA|nr:histidine kinase [Streptomyces sp. UNOB3_S3]MCC3773720.1 ATP-binding protein [Streptomyces sp. UNOB3_S3]